jgi:hypothetical protein
MELTEKRCSKCAEIKPLAAFSVSGAGFLGRRSCCRACDNQRKRSGKHRERSCYRSRQPAARQIEYAKCAAKAGKVYMSREERQELATRPKWKTPQLTEKIFPVYRGETFAQITGTLMEYYAWRDAIARCYRPTHVKFKYYGARNIAVCDRWRFGDGDKLDGFWAFLTDMRLKPAPKLSLDRINNDGNYEPGNCRWATYAQQAANQRKPYTVMERP